MSSFDATFAALSDPTRRGVIEHLFQGEASISDLAARFHMTLTGMRKHVVLLEQAGLVESAKIGRVRTCRLGQRSPDAEMQWLARYRAQWAARFEALDAVVADLKAKESGNGRKDDRTGI